MKLSGFWIYACAFCCAGLERGGEEKGKRFGCWSNDWMQGELTWRIEATWVMKIVQQSRDRRSWNVCVVYRVSEWTRILRKEYKFWYHLHLCSDRHFHVYSSFWVGCGRMVMLMVLVLWVCKIWIKWLVILVLSQGVLNTYGCKIWIWIVLCGREFVFLVNVKKLAHRLDWLAVARLNVKWLIFSPWKMSTRSFFSI